ncbi:MAG: CMD domain protein [Caldilineaceae bacterium]|nr:CMD domain protein [Caldilineaceae bacterium]
MTELHRTTAVSSADVHDIINHLAGIAPHSQLGQLRSQRLDVLQYAQGSYLALLEPEDLGNVSRIERDLIALRVATLTSITSLAAWHRLRLQGAGVDDAVIAAAAEDPDSDLLSIRQQVILAHVDLLTKAPATATQDRIAALSAVGLQPRDIVVISQLIAYLSFQVRTLVGLRILAEEN